MAVFKGRVPTAPEVKALHEKYGKPAKGQEWTHEEIEGVINVERTTSRYRAITNTWRKQLLRLHQLVVDAVPGEGFRCLTDGEALRHSDKQLKSSGRKLKKARQTALAVDDTKLKTADEKALLNHRIGAYAKLQAYFEAEQRRQLVE